MPDGAESLESLRAAVVWAEMLESYTRQIASEIRAHLTAASRLATTDDRREAIARASTFCDQCTRTMQDLARDTVDVCGDTFLTPFDDPRKAPRQKPDSH